MADTNEILAAAGRLGGLIATHPSIVAYKEVARQLDLDVAARDLLMQYEQLIERLSQKEAQMLPIEISEKRQFEQLQQSIALQPTLKRFAQAQAEYMDLMRKVQENINGGLNGQAAPAAEAAGSAPAASAPSKIILET
jgi:cell fate (sporulation/competence/biofilm development) regulator YlbF (YheA/YmcA/DUF963 family)